MANLMNIYAKNLSSVNTLLEIKKDAKEIKTSLMKTYQEASVRTSELKRNNKYIRGVFDWFKKRGDDDDNSSLLDQTEEFDSGMFQDTYKTDQTSNVLGASDMQSFAHETTREMFKIAEKKAEIHLHMTSEIITTIDDRSSEVLASLKSVDDNTRIIADKLELIVKQLQGIQEQQERRDFSYKGRLQDRSGRLTIGSVKEFIKKNEEHVTTTLTEALLDMTGLSALDAKWNENIQSFQHNFLQKILDIPFIKNNFRVGSGIIGRDYGLEIGNNYNRNPAIFDGMTRKSIISVIPDYLRQITQAVTGKRLNISNYGELTTKEIEETFTKSIDVTFDTSTFNSHDLDTFVSNEHKKNDEISESDLREVLKLMVEQYVGQVYQYSNKNHFKSSQLENGGDKGLHKHIAKLLKKSKGKTIDYWMQLIEIHSSRFVIDKNYRSNFAAAINKALNALDEAAKRSIRNARKVTETQFTQKMFDERALKRLRNDSSKFEYEGKTYRQLIREGKIKLESLSEKERANLDKPITSFEDFYERFDNSSTEVVDKFLNETQLDKLKLVKSIFDRLNSCVNVYILQDHNPFGQMELQRNFEIKPDKPPAANIDPEPTPESPSETYIPSVIDFSIQETDEDGETETSANNDEEIVSEASAILRATSGRKDTENFVSAKLAEINEPQTRQRLKTIYSSSIDRSDKKTESKSILGKAITYVFGIGKIFVSKILSKIKSFFLLQKKVILKLLKPGFTKIGRGFIAIKEGFMGSEESPGIFGRIKNFIKEKQERSMERIENAVIEAEKEKAKRKQTKGTTQTTSSTNIETQEDSGPFRKIKSFGSKIKAKLGKSQFGQGMLSAFEKKAKHQFTATSLADQSSDSIQSMLKSSSLTGASGIFYGIGKAFDYLTKQTKNWIAEMNNLTEAEKEAKRRKEELEKKRSEQKHTLAFDIGKVMGGMLNILSGILQAVMTIIMSMAGLKKIMDLINKTLTFILKPLNKAFQSLYKALKPVMKTIQNVLKKLAEYISEIVVSIVEYLQPIFEAVSPVLLQMLDVLQPILDTIVESINEIFIPMTAQSTVSTPFYLSAISNALDIFAGILQVSFGSLITIVASGMAPLGILVKIFGGDSADNLVDQIMSFGPKMIANGAKSWASGTKKQLSLFAETFGQKKDNDTAKKVQREQRSAREQAVESLNGSPMEGLYGSGDANAPYKFDDNVMDALENLKSIASGIIGLFTGETDTETTLETAKEREEYARLQMETGGLSDEDKQKIDDRGFEIYKSQVNNEKLLGETDEQYRKRYEEHKEKYWSQAAVEILSDNVKAVADGSDENAMSLANLALGFNEDDKFSKLLKAYGTDVEQGSAIESMAEFVNAINDSYYDEDDEYYDDDDEYYYEGGGTGDIIQAASEVFTVARKTAGGDLHWNGTTVRNLKFSDGMVIDKISPTHCTSMMTAIVKRMGYYVPGSGSYTDTYQGTDQLVATAGGHGSMSWGLQSSDNHPNIYDKNGKISEDWIKGVGNPQPGDITFAGIGGNIHAHMGVYKGADGTWFGFNGGADDSLANSVKLGEYYLKHGGVPSNTKLNPIPGKRCNDHQWTDQAGALAAPMTYWVRYVGPKTKGKRRKVRKSSSPSSGGGSSSGGRISGISGSKEDWIKTVAMMFEGYYYNGDKYYDNHTTHTFKIRDGRTVKARPDCSGMLGAAMTAFGYTLDYPPSSTHYNVTGMNGNLNFIHDPDGSVSKDWKLIKFTGNNLEPGDITGNKYHASFPVTNLNAAYPGGFDAGGTDNIASSAKAARALLNGESNIPWRSAMGSGAFSSGAGAWNIVRYVGGGSSSRKTTGSSSSKKSTKRTSSVSTSVSKTTSKVRSTSTTKRATSKVKTTKKGKDALIQSASEIFEAYQKTNPALTYSNGLWPNSIRTRSGHTRQIRPDCSGTMSAAIQELGYTLRDANGNEVGDIGLRSGTWGTQTKNTLIYDSPTATKPSNDWTVLDYSKSKLQKGDILAYAPPAGKASGHLTMPIVDLTTTPRGLDGGCGIAKSPAAAVAYLEGKKDIPWVQNGGMSNMKKIWRYKGTTSVSSANATARNRQTAKTTSTANRTKGAQVSTRSTKSGNKALIAASEVFLAAKEAQQRDNGPYGHGAYIKNLKFDDGMVIDQMSAMCTGTQAAIVKRMGYYLPKASGKNYSKTYQGDYAMGWANGTPSGWGINNADGHPNIYDKNGKKSKDWVIKHDGSYQPGDITLPGSAWGNMSKTMYHAHMGAFKYGGTWYGFNGGDPKNNAETIKGQNIAKYYLQKGRMPQDGDSIDISKYNAVCGLQSNVGNGVVIRYVGSDGKFTTSSTRSTSSSKKKTSTKKKTSKKKTSTKKTTTTNSSKLTGSSNAEKIWNYFRGKGLTPAGTAGLMGNLDAESNLIPTNLENTREAALGSDSVYTQRVDSGQYKNFKTDKAGYGLAQWTVSDRKGPLYDYKVKQNKSIGDMGMQLDFLNSELNQKFPGIMSTLKSTNSVSTASDKVLKEFERPAKLNYDARRSKGLAFMNTYGSGDYGTSVIDDMSYDMLPITDFMNTTGTFGSDYIMMDPIEMVPYQNTSQMIIPELSPDLLAGTDETYQTSTIVNKYKYVDGLASLLDYVDTFLAKTYDVQSIEIRSLVTQIMDEFPAYMDYYFGDDDVYTLEDDLEIQEMASAYI